MKLRPKIYKRILSFIFFFQDETRKKRSTYYVNRWITSVFPSQIDSLRSFNFNSRVDFSDECIRCNETNGTCQCPKCEADQECVTEVEHWWNKFRYIKLNQTIICLWNTSFECRSHFSHEIEYCISKNVECWTSGGNEWSPPPMIIFAA